MSNKTKQQDLSKDQSDPKLIERYNKFIVNAPVSYVFLNECLATIFVLFRDPRFKFFVWPLIQNVLSECYKCSTFQEVQDIITSKKLSDIFSEDLIDDYVRISESKNV